MDNKNERRPYYYLLKDNDGIEWVVPMSSKVENYTLKIEKEEKKRGEERRNKKEDGSGKGGTNG